MMDPRPLPSRQRIRAAFEQAAARYDEAAVLQREVGTRLLERLQLMKIAPRHILEAGSGTGFCTTQLAAPYPQARLLAVDLAHGMLCRARQRFGWWQKLRQQPAFLCADAHALPLADASVDLVFSNLVLQWCAEPEQVFAEFHRVLRPGGLLLFSSFGPDTLKELRQAWRAVDDRRHVNDFIDMHDLGDSLLHTGFTDPVMDREDLVVTYHDVRTLLDDLKTIGANRVARDRASGLTGKNKFRAMLDAYEQYRHNGLLPASYEIVYGHAWVTDAPVPQKVRNGTTSIPFAGLKSMLDKGHPGAGSLPDL